MRQIGTRRCVVSPFGFRLKTVPSNNQPTPNNNTQTRTEQVTGGIVSLASATRKATQETHGRLGVGFHLSQLQHGLVYSTNVADHQKGGWANFELAKFGHGLASPFPGSTSRLEETEPGVQKSVHRDIRVSSPHVGNPGSTGKLTTTFW